jgi:hypothetical protein
MTWDAHHGRCAYLTQHYTHGDHSSHTARLKHHHTIYPNLGRGSQPTLKDVLPTSWSSRRQANPVEFERQSTYLGAGTSLPCAR